MIWIERWYRRIGGEEQQKHREYIQKFWQKCSRCRLHIGSVYLFKRKRKQSIGNFAIISMVISNVNAIFSVTYHAYSHPILTRMLQFFIFFFFLFCICICIVQYVLFYLQHEWTHFTFSLHNNDSNISAVLFAYRFVAIAVANKNIWLFGTMTMNEWILLLYSM